MSEKRDKVYSNIREIRKQRDETVQRQLLLRMFHHMICAKTDFFLFI